MTDSPTVDPRLASTPLFARPGESKAHPKYMMREQSTLSETADQIEHDESILDGNWRLNLATFVTTWMDDQAQCLYAEAADKT